jgi:hypothetical protein
MGFLHSHRTSSAAAALLVAGVSAIGLVRGFGAGPADSALPPSRPSTTAASPFPPSQSSPGSPGTSAGASSPPPGAVPGRSATGSAAGATGNGAATSGAGGAPGDGSSPRPGSTAPPAGPASSASPSAADLRAALLTSAEVPGGHYTALSAGSGVGLSSLDGYCTALTGTPPGLGAEADATFSAGTLGPVAGETLMRFSPAAARHAMAQFAAVPRSCAAVSAKVSGLRVRISFAAVPPPALGDGTVALRAEISLTDYAVALHADLIAVRHHGTVIVVTNVEYPLNSRLTAAAASAAYAKVAARW